MERINSIWSEKRSKHNGIEKVHQLYVYCIIKHKYWRRS